MSISTQDIQHVIDVQGILTDHGVDDIKPELIGTLIDWKKGDEQPAPAPDPLKTQSDKAFAASAKGDKKREVPDDEPAF